MGKKVEHPLDILREEFGIGAVEHLGCDVPGTT